MRRMRNYDKFTILWRDEKWQKKTEKKQKKNEIK